MNIFIACAGLGTRWNNYNNTEKQLVNIDNKPLLIRTINQIKQYLNYNKIYILVNENNKDKFLLNEIINNSEIITLKNNDIHNVPALYTIKDMLVNNTLLLLGDVYFTDNALLQIKNNINKELAFFGRININNNKNTKYDELFAFYIHNNYHKEIINILNNVNNLYKLNKLDRFLHWEILTYYYYINNNTNNLNNFNINDFKNTFNNRKTLFNLNFININDLTDDFDFSYDYINFIEKIK